ncbi:bifunctional glutamate N-acetyltransferase/amino-acid acetyltransferase ArgJ [Hyphomonas sp. FCG-A18]|uniref:bifunctional glutamate N-acetyltransferase/amino-acid acetyltransferase ArgJ n=1 Tax=Hyphomonas sp. FCG-A18 TaxID=3080019 RepID=UPI002B2F3E2F|nr:bifunctional glutamate N-acetyltransferase/amino-acid acetyltransferase ArgJ [Hyphomonas sp. FCG-A18]
MNLKPSPFAPSQFPDLPAVKGVQAATASRGFYAGRGLERDDVFLFAFPEGTSCAGVFTRSSTASADVLWCREALEAGHGAARGLVVNSGNSNAFTGPKGSEKNDHTLAAMVQALSSPKEQCFLAATGVIGEPLPDPNYVGSIVPDMAARLAAPDWLACAKAFMTTDTYPKGGAESCEIDGMPVQLAGIAKGSGMIAPNMATMLAYIFTDAAIASPVLDQVLREAVNNSFNAITVDSDTSTSDTVMVFATGASGAPMITDRTDERLIPFIAALSDLCLNLALQIVKDGEGASKFVTIRVEGASHRDVARQLASDVANSPLVKTALAAGDANWGRVIMALGKSGLPLDQTDLTVWFGDVLVAERGGRAESYDEAAASAVCAQPEIEIRIRVGVGAGYATIYTCDLTHAYVDINGAYRT